MRLFLGIFVIIVYLFILTFIWVPVVFAIAIKKRYGRIGIWRGILLLVSCPMLAYIVVCTIVTEILLVGINWDNAAPIILWFVVITLLFLVWRGMSLLASGILFAITICLLNFVHIFFSSVFMDYSRCRLLNHNVLKALSVGSGLFWLVLLVLGFLMWRKRGGNEFEEAEREKDKKGFYC